jgi:hypothetical protein
MSLKDDLAARGVKVSQLAHELGEAYPNLYTALQMEHKGQEIRHKAVLTRLEAIREWLASERTAEARVEAEVQAGQDKGLFARQQRRPHPKGHVALVETVTLADGTQVGCGSVLSLPGADGAKACRYTILRLVARSGTNQVAWVDVYGGPVYSKVLDTGPDREYKTRSLTPAQLGLSAELAEIVTLS